jgi:hypothetical protein
MRDAMKKPMTSIWAMSFGAFVRHTENMDRVLNAKGTHWDMIVMDCASSMNELSFAFILEKLRRTDFGRIVVAGGMGDIGTRRDQLPLRLFDVTYFNAGAHTVLKENYRFPKEALKPIGGASRPLYSTWQN